jgi:hypothetical protein
MKHCYRSAFSVLFALLPALAFGIPSSYAGLNCVPTTQAPVIDGTMSPGEWTGTPQLTITSPILTNVYCKNDTQNLYVLVNAMGDTTDDNTVMPCAAAPNNSRCDECLLVFGDPDQTTAYVAEVWGKAGNIIGTNAHLPVGTEVAIGMNSNRFYEWKIPLSSINAVPGQTIDFASPLACKFAGSGEFCIPQASMPFDGATTNDNVWPAGVNVNDRTTWDTITLAQRIIGIPALNEWGVIVFMILAGLGAVIFLRKRRITH